MPDLKGKVAIVTGASKGIGAAIARDLASHGASVVVNYSRSKTEADAVVKQITADGGNAVAVQSDVSKVAEIRKLFADSLKAFGHVDVLVNNAGVYDFRPIEAVDEEHFDRQYDINVKGLVFATQEAVKAFDGKGGSIINISSVVSTSPKPTVSVYSSTKAAVDALTKALAAELGPKGIRVNSVLPGFTDTEGTTTIQGIDEFRTQVVGQTPLGRAGKPADIAQVVTFLASGEAAWVTGTQVTVSGGLQ